MSQEMDRVLQEEKELVFDRFRLEDALALGNALHAKAREEGQPIAVKISLNRRVLYQLSMDGCSTNTDSFLDRKENTVYQFGRSSYGMGLQMEAMGTDFHTFFGVDGSCITAPGGFPIGIRGVGCVGSISVGGMAPPADHNYIVEVVRRYLTGKGAQA